MISFSFFVITYRFYNIMHTLQNPSPSSNRRAIVRKKISMIFVVPAADVIMTPDSASTLQESTKPRPSRSPIFATPPRPDIIV
jgi:hypothetical protein